MKRIIEKHPLAIRWFHWVNFPVIMIMIWSGLLIYWANDEYHIQLGSLMDIKFFPEFIYNALDLGGHLATGMAFHFTLAWFFALNGIAYVLYTAISGEWRYLVPRKESFYEAWRVLLNDLFIKKYDHPKTKFNGAQRIVYTSVIVMGLGSLLTGLAIYKPIQLNWLTWILGGYKTARLLHFCLTMAFCGFFVVHIAQVVRAGWNNFRAMVAGFEIVQDAPTSTIESTSETPLTPSPTLSPNRSPNLSPNL
jgi:thiosulfate reductase cytochrome b subunit